MQFILIVPNINWS